ncbi:MAG: ABC transporter permease, partial [Mesorhizobium sp.]|nr:ABC transporter permease [Mesorhizobium sp.]
MSDGFAVVRAKGGEGRSSWRPNVPAQIAPLVLLLLTVGLLQAVSATPLGYFEFSTITASATTLALAVIGGTIVIIGGGLDLSVGAVVSLVNVVLVAFLGPLDLPPPHYAVLSLTVSLALGFGVGAVNGALVGYLGLQSIIVTLATMFVVSGLALLLLPYPGGTFSYEASMYFAGDVVQGLLPAPLVVIGIGLLAWGWLRRTRLGLAIYSVGSDGEAAAMNGVRTASTRFWSFAIGGAFYGAAGLFVTANSGSGDPLIGAAMLLKVFAAIALGGTVIGGGRFSLVGHLGALLLFGSFLAILGLGQGAVILSGGLDLSV